MNKQFNDFEDKRTIYSVLACGVVAFMTFLLIPLYVGLLADEIGFSDGELGVLVSMDLLGIALMSLTGGLWVDRVNWRHVMRGAIVWVLLCNVIAVFLTDFLLLCTIRWMTGLAGGLIAVIVVKSISFTLDPDRNMSIFIVFQVVFQMLGFMLMPNVIVQWGILGFFGLLNIVALMVLLASAYFPSGSMVVETQKTELIHSPQKNKSWKSVVVLLSLALFFIAQVSLFSFAERLGMDIGISAQAIGIALTISSLIGLAGAVLGVILSIRFGRFWPLLISGIIQLTCFYFWDTDVDFVLFTILISVIAFFWNFPLGYHIGVLISEDTNHRFVAYLPCFQVSGIAAGPILGGIAVEQGGYDSLALLAAVSIIIYLTLLLPFAHKHDEAAQLNSHD